MHHSTDPWLILHSQRTIINLSFSMQLHRRTGILIFLFITFIVTLPPMPMLWVKLTVLWQLRQCVFEWRRVYTVYIKTRYFYFNLTSSLSYYHITIWSIPWPSCGTRQAAAATGRWWRCGSGRAWPGCWAPGRGPCWRSTTGTAREGARPGTRRRSPASEGRW